MKQRAGQRDSQRPKLLRALAGGLIFLAIVLLWTATARGAEPATTLTCVAPVLPYDEWPHTGFELCGHEDVGGTVEVVSVAELDAETLVPVCVGGSGTGVCTSVGGSSAWRYVSSVTADTLVYVGTNFEGSYEWADTVSGWPGMTGGEDPEDPEDPDETLVDFMRSGRAFAAAFVLCGLFWGMGRGIGIILGVFRR